MDAVNLGELRRSSGDGGAKCAQPVGTAKASELGQECGMRVESLIQHGLCFVYIPDKRIAQQSLQSQLFVAGQGSIYGEFLLIDPRSQTIDVQ